MAVIDQAIYAQAKPLFCAALRGLFDPDDDWIPQMDQVVAAAREAGLNDEGVVAMAPYVSFSVQQARQGLIDPFSSEAVTHRASETPPVAVQGDLFDNAAEPKDEAERTLIDQLIAATKLYDSSEAIHELLNFTIRLRELAPFNAMLLHIQKPGLTHAATAQDWWRRFGRVPKKDARPLLILRTMGPVDFVFDIQDTKGRDVPVDAFAFPTFGNMTESRFNEFMSSVVKQRIAIVPLDAGDGQAGWIRLLMAAEAGKGKNHYELAYNRNHPAPTRSVTVAHELAHLYLGHLGADRARRVPDRRDTPHALREVEAEIAAYLVAMRNGLKPRSESYLANYKGAFEDLNLYAVTRAANAVETAMGISAQKLWKEKG
jgi:hypothetical protein